MSTFVRIGDRLFSLSAVQEIDLAYPPGRHNATKPPSKESGVQVVLMSGHQLAPFWDAQADVLRRYLNGEDVTSRRYRDGDAIRVIELVPLEAEADAPPASLSTWNGATASHAEAERLATAPLSADG